MAAVSVDMVADAKQGNRAVIRSAGRRARTGRRSRDRIRERMKYYPTPYEIEWAGWHRGILRQPT